jgi:hypothetical protein
MSTTSLSVTSATSAVLEQVADAFRKDPAKFAKDIASDPAALGLSGDTFSYSLNVDGQASSGQVTAGSSGSSSGGISLPDDSWKRHASNSGLDGFNAQPIASTSTPTSTSTDSTNAAAASGSALYPSGEPTVQDVNQGEIGDCALDAQLASLAANNPSAIKNMISADPAGGYDVTLYPNGQKTSVHVDQSDIDALKGTTGSNHQTDWASVVEAATVKAGENYANGSDPGQIMGLLTGTNGSDELTSSLGGSSTAIQSALSSGKLVSASASVASDGVIAGHAYSVLSATDDTVTVRNPWGDSSSNDGVETMSTADFLSKFDGVQIQN